jgi:hypothetical protein
VSGMRASYLEEWKWSLIFRITLAYLGGFLA